MALTRCLAAVVLLSAFSGMPLLAQDEEADAAQESAAPQPIRAIAVVHSTKEAKGEIRGTVRFEDVRDGVQMKLELEGLPPDQELAFHIHEFGDCSAPDASSAGAHYNPEGHPHAGPDADKRHAGDLGNLKTDSAGKAQVEQTYKGISVAGKNPIVGRAVIVHAKADDLKSQPTGNAGGRIACGIIGIAK